MKTTQREIRRRMQRAFTLVEVLIAVLVLSLGLLGLAAIFPAVIAQQRNAVDRTQGAVVAKVVQQSLNSSQFMVDFSGLRRDFWFSADAALGCGNGFDLDPDDMNFLWEPTWQWGQAGHMAISPAQVYRTSGMIVVGFGKFKDMNCADQSPEPEDLYRVPVTARLYPQPYTGEQPRYVWDFVPRRARLSGDSSDIEIAVFIRRIDPRIRVPRGKTLSDVLTGNNGVGVSQARLPLGADPANLLPTGDGAAVDGTGTYSMPLTMPVIVRSTEPDQIVLDASANATMRDLWKQAIASPGQIIIDNLGNVLNVIEVPEERNGELSIVVDHRYAEDATDFNFGVDPRGVKVEQILFTVQKPVRALTFRPDW